MLLIWKNILWFGFVFENVFCVVFVKVSCLCCGYIGGYLVGFSLCIYWWWSFNYLCMLYYGVCLVCDGYYMVRFSKSIRWRLKVV